MLQAVQAQADARWAIEWLAAADSTIVRARQHAAGAREGGAGACSYTAVGHHRISPAPALLI
ncbi:hypothetical protein GBF35_28750 [Nonomuraea phyllanthi]|uniref:hypothetical protein n=1 Tax=Nonomuraea phyllanthi TaxID=2219224 RepID=UPI001294078C|nr:hypothetical protein GBF35_28750 [Nonomuraea phyllanthi]